MEITGIAVSKAGICTVTVKGKHSGDVARQNLVVALRPGESLYIVSVGNYLKCLVQDTAGGHTLTIMREVIGK